MRVSFGEGASAGNEVRSLLLEAAGEVVLDIVLSFCVKSVEIRD